MAKKKLKKTTKKAVKKPATKKVKKTTKPKSVKALSVPKKEPKLVHYKETKVKGLGGKSFSVPEGEPNGGFQLPGFTEVYSLRALADWLRDNIPQIVPEVQDEKISDEGYVTSEDGARLSGDPVPSKKEEKKLTKVGASFGDVVEVCLEHIKQNPNTSKADLMASMGIKEYTADKVLDALKTKLIFKTEKNKKLYSARD